MKKLAPILILLLLLAGCSAQPQEKTLYIAEQFGTAYAPVTLMKERGTLQSMLPEGTTIQWAQLGNTAAIREAMLAGEMDIGFIAIPPFLIGKDAGTQWSICSGLSEMPIGLVSSNEDIKTLADIGSARIALPQPGSIQHILLAMAAEKQLGQHDIFDNQLVTMAHPDGMNALLSGTEVELHFTTAPYLAQELEAGMHLVLSGEEAMGQPFTGIIAVARDGFIEEEEQLYEAFLQALHESIAYIEQNPEEAAKILAPVYGMSEEQLLKELTDEGAAYKKSVEGLDSFVDFMYRTGYINKQYQLSELVTPDVETK